MRIYDDGLVWMDVHGIDDPTPHFTVRAGCHQCGQILHDPLARPSFRERLEEVLGELEALNADAA